jgi:hypothetical protein
MEKFACWIVKHEISRVSISDSKHVSSHALTCK